MKTSKWNLALALVVWQVTAVGCGDGGVTADGGSDAGGRTGSDGKLDQATTGIAGAGGGAGGGSSGSGGTDAGSAGTDAGSAGVGAGGGDGGAVDAADAPPETVDAADAPRDTVDAPEGSSIDAPQDLADTMSPSDAPLGDAYASCKWTGDFDGDGVTDCAVLRQTAGARGDILFYKGLAGGQLASSPVVSAGIVPIAKGIEQSLPIIDLDHDSRQDIVVVSHVLDLAAFPQVRGTFVQLFSGQADGTFVPHPTNDGLALAGGSIYYDATASPAELWADFDGDGFKDIVGRDGDHTAWFVITSAPAGSFKVVESPINVGRGLLNHIATASLNGDVNADLVTLAVSTGPVGCHGAGLSGGGIYLFFGAANGLVPRFVDGSEFSQTVSLSDIDNDGRPDLTVTYMTQGTTVVCGSGCRKNNQQVFLSSNDWNASATCPL